LKDEYHAADNAALFDSLKELLPDEPGAPSQADIAAHLGMTENAVRQAFHRFRQRYQSLCERRLPTLLRHPAISKMSCAISLRWSRRSTTRITRMLDTNYTNSHEFLKLWSSVGLISLNW